MALTTDDAAPDADSSSYVRLLGAFAHASCFSQDQEEIWHVAEQVLVPADMLPSAMSNGHAYVPVYQIVGAVLSHTVQGTGCIPAIWKLRETIAIHDLCRDMPVLLREALYRTCHIAEPIDWEALTADARRARQEEDAAQEAEARKYGALEP